MYTISIKIRNTNKPKHSDRAQKKRERMAIVRHKTWKLKVNMHQPTKYSVYLF